MRKIILSDKIGKNQFVWASDAPLEKINGTAEGVEGTLTLDPKDVGTLKGTIATSVTTMKTGIEMRDNHLKGEGWLDAEKYPTITFSADSVADINVVGNKMFASAVGKFTLYGVSQTMKIPITLLYVEASAATRERGPGDFIMLTADFELALKDFNVTGVRG
jgi:polyisoprenoid-binding protein YceI